MLKDVKGVGQRDTLKDVSDGYGLNFLVAQGLAVQATPEKIAELERRQKTQTAVSANREKELAELILRLKEAAINIPAKANATGHLYTQLSSKMIIDAVKKELNTEIPQNAVLLSSPIKEIGESEVSMKFGAHTANFTVNVVALK